MQLLTPLHLESFELLCDQWDIYQTKSIGIRKGSLSETFATDKGYEQRSPHAVARDKAFDSFMQLAAKFGLTPYALKSIQSKSRGGGGNSPTDPVSEFAAAKYETD